MRKVLKWVIGFMAISFFFTALTLRHNAAFTNGLEVLRWVLMIGAVGVGVYPIFRGLFGVTVSRQESWKYKISVSKLSPAAQLLTFAKQMLHGVFIGCRDWSEFREGMKDAEAILLRKELFTVLAAFVICFNLGLFNLLFPAAFWYLASKQFDCDFVGSVHIASCEILTGFLVLTTIVLLHPGLWILLVYPVVSFLWIVLYLRDKQMSINLVLLQFAKILIFVLSKYLPYLLLSHFTLPV